MKKIFLILTIMFSVASHCQENIHNFIIGQWEFKINVKEVIKNSDELSGLEKMAARAFSGVIEKTLEDKQANNKPWYKFWGGSKTRKIRRRKGNKSRNNKRNRSNKCKRRN